MKGVVILFGLISLVAADTYSSKNDDFDIEALLANKEAHQSFLDCFLDKNPCDGVPTNFKKDLPEAVLQACAKCTDAQKHIFVRFLAGTKVNFPQRYNDFKNKYDPNGEYFAALEQAISNA